LVTVEEMIASAPSTAVSSLSTAQAENPVCAKNRQIDLWSILSDVKA
jgi:hypothetical protein